MSTCSMFAFGQSCPPPPAWKASEQPTATTKSASFRYSRPTSGVKLPEMPMQKGSSWNSPRAGSVVDSSPPVFAASARQAAPAPASTAPRPASTTTRSAAETSFAAAATSLGCGGIGEGRGSSSREGFGRLAVPSQGRACRSNGTPITTERRLVDFLVVPAALQRRFPGEHDQRQVRAHRRGQRGDQLRHTGPAGDGRDADTPALSCVRHRRRERAMLVAHIDHAASLLGQARGPVHVRVAKEREAGPYVFLMEGFCKNV